MIPDIPNRAFGGSTSAPPASGRAHRGTGAPRVLTSVLVVWLLVYFRASREPGSVVASDARKSVAELVGGDRAEGCASHSALQRAILVLVDRGVHASVRVDGERDARVQHAQVPIG